MVVPKKAYLTVILALSLTACLIYAHTIKASSLAGLRLAEFPMEIGGWEGRSVPYPDWLPEELGANEFFIRTYRNSEGSTVDLYVAYFDARYGGTTHNPYICYPAQGWQIAQSSQSATETGGITVEFTRLMMQKGFEKQLVLFYYQMGDRIMPRLSDYRLAAIVQGILFSNIGGALVQVSAPVDGAVEKAYTAETAFLEVIAPLIEEYLPD
jgi:EpsI family protein